MSVYLDASVLVSSFILDDFSDRSDAFLSQVDQAVVVSDLAAAEVASVMARLVRTGQLTKENALSALSNFDQWTAGVALKVEIAGADVSEAAGLIRRLDLPLRTPDALHIAIARRSGSSLATFDVKMAASARALGLPVVEM